VSPRQSRRIKSRRDLRVALKIVCIAFVVFVAPLAGCRRIGEKVGVMSVRPRALRDVPSVRLAFHLESDVSTDALPENLKNETPDEPLEAVRKQFESQRKDEALLRTVVSPDSQRALALYAPNDPTFPPDEFLIDLYSAEGAFIRNVMPQGLSGVFMSSVEWSADGQWIVFTGRRTAKPEVKPTPTEEPQSPTVSDPNAQPAPSASIAPIIAPVATFRTEQIYVCDRDGFNLRPLTSREGLVYFHAAWSPDGRAVVALACKEDELSQRIGENKPLAGRPRIIERDGGRERLLSDQLMDALPVWSPDAAKVATAAGTDVMIYDAIGEKPTSALLPLRDPLLASSADYDAKHLQHAATVNAGAQKDQKDAQSPPPQPTGATPLSFNPVIRLEWTGEDTLLVETGYVRIFKSESEPTRRYLRWHVLHLSPQAVVMQ
jgi:hypothetical protein